MLLVDSHQTWSRHPGEIDEGKPPEESFSTGPLLPIAIDAFKFDMVALVCFESRLVPMPPGILDFQRVLSCLNGESEGLATAHERNLFAIEKNLKRQGTEQWIATTTDGQLG